jgi:hypothetical protein
MALQIRRGLATDRAAVTPAAGELLYTTDQHKLYVGDGSTAGGTLVTGSGISNLVEDTSPQLGGNLDVNSYSIVSTSNGNIALDPNGSGTIQLNANITTTGNITKTGELNITPTTLLSIGRNTDQIDGNLYITRNSYSSAIAQGVTFAQHHNTPDTVNHTFYRSRGTSAAQLAVTQGDKLGEIVFAGFEGTGPVFGARIDVTVDGTVATSRIPTKIAFITNSTVNTTVRAEISSTGLKVNSIQNLSGTDLTLTATTDLTLTATTVKIAGDVQINSQGDLKFADADSSNYVAFQAPASVGSNITWTLPSTTGIAGEVLTAGGGGVLSWSAPLASAAPASATSAGMTGQIAFDATHIYVCIAPATWVRATLATWS